METKDLIFLIYASGDQDRVIQYYDFLKEAGLNPWIDFKDILGGQDADSITLGAIEKASVVIYFISNQSNSERGNVQKYLNLALEKQKEKLPSDTYIIPIKLDSDAETPLALKTRHIISADSHNIFKQLRKSLDYQLCKNIRENTKNAITISNGNQKNLDINTWEEQWHNISIKDDIFIGRTDTVTRLNDWAADPSIHLVTICALGGTGKTSLALQWITTSKEKLSEKFSGIFAWSFYHCADVKLFFQNIINFSSKFNTRKPKTYSNIGPFEVQQSLKESNILIILDGLEIIQEARNIDFAEQDHYYLDENMSYFLNAFCSQKTNKNFLVITTRYPVQDLNKFIGVSHYELKLTGLTDNEGATLLQDLGIQGPDYEHRYISKNLNGHPLALLLFSQTIPEVYKQHPKHYFHTNFSHNKLFSERLQHIFSTFEKQISSIERASLFILSVFSSPITLDELVVYSREIFNIHNYDALSFSHNSCRLQSCGIITPVYSQDKQYYTCHPLIHSHFRSSLINNFTKHALKFADVLIKKSPPYPASNICDIKNTIIAIEIYTKLGKFQKADKLYKNHLKDGSSFNHIPAFVEGAKCALNFYYDYRDTMGHDQKLPQKRIIKYYNDIAYFSTFTANYNQALIYYHKIQEIEKKLSCSTTSNITTLYIYLGRTNLAIKTAQKSLDTALKHKDLVNTYYLLALSGWAYTLSGDINKALTNFTQAKILQIHLNICSELSYLCDIRFSEFFVRSGLIEHSKELTQKTLIQTSKKKLNALTAGCFGMLAACALAQNNLIETQKFIKSAEKITRQGHMLYQLPQLFLINGNLSLQNNDIEHAERWANEALILSSARNMKFVHADSLVLLGKAILAQNTLSSASKAIDISENAQSLAKSCNYPWAERDALFLEVEARRQKSKLTTPDKSLYDDISIKIISLEHKAKLISDNLKISPDKLKKEQDHANDWLLRLLTTTSTTK